MRIPIAGGSGSVAGAGQRWRHLRICRCLFGLFASEALFDIAAGEEPTPHFGFGTGFSDRRWRFDFFNPLRQRALALQRAPVLGRCRGEHRPQRIAER